MQLVVESIFNEGRCIHANEGNINRIQECAMCFNHVVMKVNSMLLPIKIIFVLGKEDVDENEIREEARIGGPGR